jgi:CheY-like chemotaxis protein
MRIFVVEDEEEVACCLQALLLDAGHTPLVVPCVDLALDRFAAAPPDAVLLSLHYYFPGLSGFDFLQGQPVRESSVPIITLSASPTESEARESLRLGALDYVGKGVSPDLLRGVVAYLELHAAGERAGGTGIAPERRRSLRPGLAGPVRVAEGNGAEWQGDCVNLSTFGIKIRSRRPMAPRDLAKLQVPSPDGAPALELLAIRLRRDPDGDCFRFVSLSETAFRSLSDIVRAQTKAV